MGPMTGFGYFRTYTSHVTLFRATGVLHVHAIMIHRNVWQQWPALPFGDVT